MYIFLNYKSFQIVSEHYFIACLFTHNTELKESSLVNVGSFYFVSVFYLNGYLFFNHFLFWDRVSLNCLGEARTWNVPAWATPSARVTGMHTVPSM